MKRPAASRCARCGKDHAAALAAMESGRVMGEPGPGLESAAGIARALYADLVGEGHNRMVSARSPAVAGVEAGRGVVGRVSERPR